MRVLELHAPMRAIKRSDGRSAVGVSAYITRTAMRDERTGESHDYRRKGGVELTGLMLQEEAPDWAHDRARLWNEAEKAARRKDAQTAREIEISMPHEFTPEMRREATLRVASMIVRRYGGAVEYAIHKPGEDSDARNWHAHLLFSTRAFTEDGQWAAKGRTVQPEDLPEGYPRDKPRFITTCPLDDVKRGPEEMLSLRAEIASIQNDIATRERLPVFIEHLSYERRGIDREASQHMGRMATTLERRGQVTDIGTRNRETASRNAERASLDEEIKAKVIEIEEARSRIAIREAAKTRTQPQTQEEIYAAFYRDTYDRRGVMIQAFEKEHGAREKELRDNAARLTQQIENAGFFAGLWRRFTGQTRRDQQELAAAQAGLEAIRAERAARWNRFEADRLERLDALKAEQARQVEARLEPLRATGTEGRTVGERNSGQAPVPPPPAPPVAEESREAKARRDYFRRQAIARNRAREEAAEPERDESEAARQRRAEEIKRAREANPLNLTSDENAALGRATPKDEISNSGRSRYDIAKDAYKRRLRREQGRDREGPERDDGPEPGFE